MSLIPAGREREPLFSGLATCVRFGQEGGRPLARLEAVSYTMALEGEEKRRSFQQEGRTYGALVRELLAPYQGAYIWNAAGRDEPVGRFLLQYGESDWAFLKRLASLQGQGILPEVRFPGAKLYVGLPGGRKAKPLETGSWRLHRALAIGKEKEDNEREGRLQEGTEIRLEGRYEDYAPGDRVLFRGQELAVTHKASRLEKGEWRHDYRLRRPEECRTVPIKNRALAGAAVQGRVAGRTLTPPGFSWRLTGPGRCLKADT